MDKKVLIIVPAYNEAKNIEGVIRNLTEKTPQYDYIIINDCSKDETEKIYSEKSKCKKERIWDI